MPRSMCRDNDGDLTAHRVFLSPGQLNFEPRAVHTQPIHLIALSIPRALCATPSCNWQSFWNVGITSLEKHREDERLRKHR